MRIKKWPLIGAAAMLLSATFAPAQSLNNLCCVIAGPTNHPCAVTCHQVREEPYEEWFTYSTLEETEICGSAFTLEITNCKTDDSVIPQMQRCANGTVYSSLADCQAGLGAMGWMEIVDCVDFNCP